MAIQPELWHALLPVIDVFASLAVRYCVGGSVASSFTGVARATLDVDLVAELKAAHAAPFTAALEHDYYVDLEMVQEAIRNHRSFNLIHLATMFKVDVFIMEPSVFARENMRRRIGLEVPEIQRVLYFTSPEDIVLHKLLWYAMGDGVSDRQWYDLQGVLRLQTTRLDLVYMHGWANQLGLSALLHRALDEAGLS